MPLWSWEDQVRTHPLRRMPAIREPPKSYKAREAADAAASIQWLEAVPSHLLARLRRGEPNGGRDG